MIKLFELLLEVIPPEVFSHKIPNPNWHEGSRFRKKVSVGYALKTPRTKPLYAAGRKYLMQYIQGNTSSTGNDPDNDSDTTTQTQASSGGIVPVSPEGKNEALRILQSLTDKGFFNMEVQARSSDTDMYGDLESFPQSTMYSDLESFLQSTDGQKVSDALKQHTNLTMTHLLDFAAQTGASFKKASGEEYKMSVTITNPGDSLKIIVKTVSAGQSRRQASITAVLNLQDPAQNYVYGDLIVLDDSQAAPSGAGATAGIKDSLEQFDRLGINKIKYDAGLEAGGFKWAQIGGIPEPRDVSNLTKTVNDRFDRLLGEYENPSNRTYDKRTMQAISTLKRLDASGELELVKELIETCIEQLKNGNGEFLSILANTPLGMPLLVETWWHGYFDITLGSESREVFESQLR